MQYQICHYDSLDSTMYEVERIKSFSPLTVPLVVSADIQTTGSGRGDHQWYSPPGGLWFTLCFQHPQAIASMALYVGACIHQTLTFLFPQLQPQIKWTNDIYLREHKLAGILCKYYPQEQLYAIGIGINTNNSTEFDNINAASLVQHLHYPLSNHTIRHFICHSILKGLGSLNPIDNITYCNQYLYGIGRIVNVENGTESLSGTIVKINYDGSLCLLVANQLRDVYSGSLIFPNL